MILALDLGTTTGFAAHNRNDTQISGTFNFRPGRFEGGGMRYLRFRQKLDDLHHIETITKVYFEEVRRHVGTDAAHVYGGLMGQLTAWCEERKVPYLGVPVGTIKKHIAGKGNATKDQVIAAVQAKGWLPGDDNEADAIALLDYALESLS